jgi:acetyl-CoA acetyltransferase
MTESAIVATEIADWRDAGSRTPPAEILAGLSVEVLRRAGLRPKELDAIVANTMALPFDSPSHITLNSQLLAHRVAEKIGALGAAALNVSAACASQMIAFSVANDMIRTGSARSVLVVGYDNSPRGFYYQSPSYLDSDLAAGYPHQVVGITNPDYWAMWARRRAYEMGKSVEDIKLLMARVKEELSRNGALNPHARYRRIFTKEEVLGSPVVADPLHLYMISAVSSGGGSALIMDAERAEKLVDDPVRIAASKVGGPAYDEPSPRLVNFSTAGGRRASRPFIEWRRTIEAAYKEAGVSAEDMDMMEVHDTSAFHVINWIDQAMGWEREETDRLIEEGGIGRRGRLPVNLSGGTSSFGEAVQSQALMMVHEMVLQLRGEAGERQAAKKLRRGLVTAYGAYGAYGAMVLETGR